MSLLLSLFERASIFGLFALAVVLAIQVLLEGRVPAAWRVWIWRVALFQTLLALIPVAPLRLVVLPPIASPPQPQPYKSPSHLVPSPALADAQVTSPSGKAIYRVNKPTSLEATGGKPSFALWWIPGFYALGVVFHLALFLRTWLRLRKQLRQCTPLQDEEVHAHLTAVAHRIQVRPLPRLLASSGQVPFVAGALRPSIVIPTALLSSQKVQLDAVLAHELSHVKRRDLMWNGLLWVIQTLLWFHPLIWASRRTLPLEIESACDEMVLRSVSIAPFAYGQLLLNTMHVEQTPLAVGVTDGYSSLKTRLLRLNRAPKRPSRLLHIAFAGALALTFGALVPIRLEAQTQTPILQGEVLPLAALKPSAMGGLLTKLQQVQGRVLAPNNQPIAGASVSWVAYSKDEYHSGTVLSTVQCDAQGRFRFDDSASLIAQTQTYSGTNLDLTPPQLFIEEKKWGLSRKPIAALASGHLDIHLASASELQASYVDGKGQPIPDLRVRLRFLDFKQSAPGAETGSFLTPSEMKRFEERTDAAGVVHFPGLPQGAGVFLEVEDERFAQLEREESQIELARTAKTIAPPIHLVAGATIKGRLTYGPSGLPAVGVQVYAQDRGARWGAAVSDGNGEYQMKSLLAGSYNLSLDLQDNLSGDWTARAHEKVVVARGDHLQNMDFQLVHGVLITGKVTAEGSAEPIAGLQIGIYGPAKPRSSGGVQTAETAKDGTYRLRVPEGKQLIYLMSAPPIGFGPPQEPPTSSVPLQRSNAFANETYDVEVKDGEKPTVSWQLPKVAAPLPIQVQVVDEKGTPAAGVQVAMSSPLGAGPITLTRNFTTDAQGHLTLENIRTPITLRSRQGDSATVQATEAKSGDKVTLRLEADTMAAIKCLITDAKGQPIPRAKISLIRWVNGLGAGEEGVSVDAEGRHTFSDLWPDIKYSVKVTAPGYSQVNSQPLQLEPGEWRSLKPLVLSKVQ